MLYRFVAEGQNAYRDPLIGRSRNGDRFAADAQAEAQDGIGAAHDPLMRSRDGDQGPGCHCAPRLSSTTGQPSAQPAQVEGSPDVTYHPVNDDPCRDGSTLIRTQCVTWQTLRGTNIDENAEMVNRQQATYDRGCAGVCALGTGPDEILSDVVQGTNRPGDLHAEEKLVPWALRNLKYAPIDHGRLYVTFIIYYSPCSEICQPQIPGWEEAIRAAAPPGVETYISWWYTAHGVKPWSFPAEDWW